MSQTKEQKAALDQRVLEHLRTVKGSTAWAMSDSVGATREEVSKACRRLKRKDLVETCADQSTYWQAVQP